jgi:predicted permease
MLTETALVTTLGLALGLFVARWGGAAVRSTVLPGTTWDADPVNGRVLFATAAAAVVAAFLASLWPLLRGARVDVAAEMHGAGRTTGGLAPRVRGALLLTQTALCTVAVVAAGLFLRSIGTIQSLDLGIDPANVSLASVDLAGLDTPDAEVAAFYDRVTERVRAIPGVTAAGVTFAAPFLSNMGGRIVVPGRDSLPRLAGGGPYYFAVGPGTGEALGVRLLAGRLFAATDRRGSPPVALVSERMARTIWPTESALGKCFHVGADTMPCLEIVGVVADVNRQELDEKPFFLYFSVLEQEPGLGAPQMLVVRHVEGATDIPAQLRRAFLAERGDLPWVSVRPYEEILDRQARPWKVGATLFTIFAGLSLVIAAIGLYGVVAFGVSQRTRELGLRAALGATPRQLLRAVLSGGLVTAVTGVAIGLGGALLAAPRIEALLFRTRAADPLVFTATAVLVALVSLAAAWLPGRRATRIDPMQALRVE